MTDDVLSLLREATQFAVARNLDEAARSVVEARRRQQAQSVEHRSMGMREVNASLFEISAQRRRLEAAIAGFAPDVHVQAERTVGLLVIEMFGEEERRLLQRKRELMRPGRPPSSLPKTD